MFKSWEFNDDQYITLDILEISGVFLRTCEIYTPTHEDVLGYEVLISFRSAESQSLRFVDKENANKFYIDIRKALEELMAIQKKKVVHTNNSTRKGYLDD